MALERVKPISRDTARLTLTEQILEANCETPEAVIDLFEKQFFSVPLTVADRTRLADYLAQQLGTREVLSATSFLEEPLRHLLHLLLSLPEYQLG